MSIQTSRIAKRVTVGLWLCTSTTVCAHISVESWNLATAVQDFTQEIPQQVSRFETVSNPFANSHSATLGPGTATTSYDLSWSAHHATFRFDVAHVVPDLHNDIYNSLSTGSILFTTTEPMIAHLVGAYTYSLPVSGMTVVTSFSIFDWPITRAFMTDGHVDDTILSPAPLTGSFSSDRTALLPAAGSYGISYTVRLTATHNTGALGTGDGFFQLNLDPVPEPATSTVLAIGIVGARFSTRVRKNPHHRER